MKKRVFIFSVLIAVIAFYTIQNRNFVNVVIACVFAGDHSTLSAYILNQFHMLLSPFAMFFAYMLGAVLPTFNKAILFRCCLDLYGTVPGVIAALALETLVASVYFFVFKFFFARICGQKMTRNCFSGKSFRFIHNNGFSMTLYMRLQPWFPSELATMISASCRVKYGDFLRASIVGKLALMLSKAVFDNYRLFFIGSPRSLARLFTISVIITIIFLYKYHRKYRKDIFDEKI